ncbi:hypothetical protein TNCV_1721811 [Trichonephila clavipes]|nr:hypothetical protein TNCV_1721811 [Trichonephila clavipes]
MRVGNPYFLCVVRAELASMRFVSYNVANSYRKERFDRRNEISLPIITTIKQRWNVKFILTNHFRSQTKSHNGITRQLQLSPNLLIGRKIDTYIPPIYLQSNLFPAICVIKTQGGGKRNSIGKKKAAKRASDGKKVSRKARSDGRAECLLNLSSMGGVPRLAGHDLHAEQHRSRATWWRKT